MSDAVLPCPGGSARPLWHAGLAGLIAQATAALVPAMIVREALIAHLHEGLKPWEGPFVRPAMWTPSWFGDLAVAYGWAFLCVLPGTLLFLIILTRLERTEARTGLELGIVGAISAIPLAICLCILVSRTEHAIQPPPDFGAVVLGYLIVAAVPCLIGLCGGAVAARFREQPGRSDPL